MYTAAHVRDIISDYDPGFNQNAHAHINKKAAGREGHFYKILYKEKRK